MIEDAIARAGKNPKELVTDGLGSYSAALEQSGSEIDHVRNVGISHRENNNRIEAFHGTVTGWTKSRRGMKGRGKEDLEGFSSYYNFVRPHQGRGNKPPNQTSKNCWLSVIRNMPTLDPTCDKTSLLQTQETKNGRLDSPRGIRQADPAIDED